MLHCIEAVLMMDNHPILQVITHITGVCAVAGLLWVATVALQAVTAGVLSQW